MHDGDLEELAERYVALWNEPDPETRGKVIRELWAPHGTHCLVDPPQEIREAAANLAFPAPPLGVHGYEALEARTTRAYEMFIASGEHAFVARGTPSRLSPNVVTLGWAMVSTASGDPVGGGVDVLALDNDGRIRIDYQFIGG